MNWLLDQDLVVITEPIKAELLSGTHSDQDYAKLQDLLDELTLYSGLDLDYWEKIARIRFELARKGMQVHLIDLWIALIAEQNNLLLFTLDKDFLQIKKLVDLEFYEKK